jgi:hypothetical protein
MATTGRSVSVRSWRMAISPICTEAPLSSTTTPAEVITNTTLAIIPRFSGVGNPSAANTMATRGLRRSSGWLGTAGPRMKSSAADARRCADGDSRAVPRPRARPARRHWRRVAVEGGAGVAMRRLQPVYQPVMI